MQKAGDPSILGKKWQHARAGWKCYLHHAGDKWIIWYSLLCAMRISLPSVLAIYCTVVCSGSTRRTTSLNWKCLAALLVFSSWDSTKHSMWSPLVICLIKVSACHQVIVNREDNGSEKFAMYKLAFLSCLNFLFIL